MGKQTISGKSPQHRFTLLGALSALQSTKCQTVQVSVLGAPALLQKSKKTLFHTKNFNRFFDFL
jgi:hypothetical protein